MNQISEPKISSNEEKYEEEIDEEEIKRKLSLKVEDAKDRYIGKYFLCVV